MKEWPCKRIIENQIEYSNSTLRGC